MITEHFYVQYHDQARSHVNMYFAACMHIRVIAVNFTLSVSVSGWGASPQAAHPWFRLQHIVYGLQPLSCQLCVRAVPVLTRDPQCELTQRE